MALKRELGDWIDERQERFTTISDQIWERPEVAMAEHFACDLQAETLEADGFRITRNVGDQPTAFTAEWGEGAPIIGFLGEYDALPGLSQKSQATKDPVVPEAPGHGCGHNLLGTGAMAAAMAVKAWLNETGQSGTVRYYGCPAEETITGKVYMARAGAYDDLDAAITWHPWGTTTVSLGSSLAVDNLRFRFFGKTAHAAAQPEQGRSALDAVELMNNGVNYLREHVIEKARIHYVITNGGGAPNVVPDEAEVWYFVRAPEREQVEAITARVRKIAEGATLMTETTWEEDFQAGAYNVLPNKALADLALGVLRELDPLEFTAEEQEFAGTVISGFPDGIREAAVKARSLPSKLLDAPLVGDVIEPADEGEVGAGSTDVGDVSWITPTLQVHTTCWPFGIPGHSWGITSTGAMSIGHKGMIQAAKAMAITAAELYTNPEELAKAQAEFKERLDGRVYKTPLPEGAKPPAPQKPRA